RSAERGEGFFEPAGALYTVMESASATDPASAIAVMIVPEGAPLLTPERYRRLQAQLTLRLKQITTMNIKYAMRQLVLQRELAMTVIALLAVGIGATSAMYPMVQQVIL